MSHSNFIHTMVKHKDYISYVLLNQFPLKHLDIATQALKSISHKPQNLLPYLSYHNISIHLNLLKQIFYICLFCLIMFELYGVFMLCYFCAIVCAKSYVLVERSGKIVFFKRQVTHISSTYFYYCISVFQYYA
jgi:hypothetical protein